MKTPSFTCPRCGAVSHNCKDVAEGYCGRCHDWTRAPESVKPSQCPACGKKLDCASLFGSPNIKPSPGDFSVCIGCAEVLVFTPTLDLRSADLNDLISEPAARRHIEEVQSAIREMHRTYPH